jgi:hypothetical protein
MHERDLRKDLDLCFERQDPCFRVFLKVIQLLDKVGYSVSTSRRALTEKFNSFWLSTSNVGQPLEQITSENIWKEIC